MTDGNGIRQEGERPRRPRMGAKMIASEYDADDLANWTADDLADAENLIRAERDRRAAARRPAASRKADDVEARVNAQWAAETGDKDAFTL